MQNIKILIIGVLSLLIIAACQKESAIETNAPETSTNQKLDNENGIVYIYKGEAVSKTDIDWESETLNIVHGFAKENEVLLFDNDETLITWAKTVEGGELFINTLNNVAEALAMAEKMGEFERMEQTGIVSKEYEKYLKQFSSGNRLILNLFEHSNYGGNQRIIFNAVHYVGNSFNDKASSLKGAFGGFLAEHKWWRGSKLWFWTGNISSFVPYGFNDKCTSAWIVF